MESAGACCKLINIPESITLETLVVKESIVIATKEEPKNEEERMWAELISNFLIRCVILRMYTLGGAGL